MPDKYQTKNFSYGLIALIALVALATIDLCNLALKNMGDDRELPKVKPPARIILSPISEGDAIIASRRFKLSQLKLVG